MKDWANLLDKDLRSVNVKEKKDREGINTESLYSIVDLNPRKKLYTINMYHTTSSGLINGNHIDVFTQQDLPQILLKLKVQNLDVKATNDACKMALKAYAKLTYKTSTPDKGPINDTRKNPSSPLHGQQPVTRYGRLRQLGRCPSILDPTDEVEKGDLDQPTRETCRHDNHSDAELPRTPVRSVTGSSTVQKLPNTNKSTELDAGKLKRTLSSPEPTLDETTYPCIACEKNCTEHCVWCDVGNHWIHYRCAKATQAQIKILEDPRNINTNYTCPVCASLEQETNEVDTTCAYTKPDDTVLKTAQPAQEENPPIGITLPDQEPNPTNSLACRTLPTDPRTDGPDEATPVVIPPKRGPTLLLPTAPGVDQTSKIQELTNKEKALKTKERNLQTRERMLKEQELELSDLAKKLACARAYTVKLEEDVKAEREENRFLRLRLAALHEAPSAEHPLSHNAQNNMQQAPSSDLKADLYRLENQILQMRLDEATRHIQLQETIDRHGTVLQDITWKLRQLPIEPYQKPAHDTQSHYPKRRRNRKRPHQTRAEIPRREDIPEPKIKRIYDYNHGYSMVHVGTPSVNHENNSNTDVTLQTSDMAPNSMVPVGTPIVNQENNSNTDVTLQTSDMAPNSQNGGPRDEASHTQGSERPENHTTAPTKVNMACATTDPKAVDNNASQALDLTTAPPSEANLPDVSESTASGAPSPGNQNTDCFLEETSLRPKIT